MSEILTLVIVIERMGTERKVYENATGPLGKRDSSFDSW
jgi:hypothetical protein